MPPMKASVVIIFTLAVLAFSCSPKSNWEWRVKNNSTQNARVFLKVSGQVNRLDTIDIKPKEELLLASAESNIGNAESATHNMLASYIANENGDTLLKAHGKGADSNWVVTYQHRNSGPKILYYFFTFSFEDTDFSP